MVRSTLSDAELAACRVQYDALVSAMREVAERHSLQTANVLGNCRLIADVVLVVNDLTCASRAWPC